MLTSGNGATFGGHTGVAVVLVGEVGFAAITTDVARGRVSIANVTRAPVKG